MPPYFPIVKFHAKWTLKSAIYGYKISISCINHETLQKVTDQQIFQDPTGFGSWYSIILKILTGFGEKMAKIKNRELLVFYKNGYNSSSK